MTLRFLSAGESHGAGLWGIVEGMPAQVPIDAHVINAALARRQGGYGRSGRMAIEQDEVRILSGVRHGLTTGAPIGLLIPNRDHINWQAAMAVLPPEIPLEAPLKSATRPRPGHADWPGACKYDMSDFRPVMERASARQTAMRVAIGALAQQWLCHLGVSSAAHVVQIGAASVVDPARAHGMSIAQIRSAAAASVVSCLEPEASAHMVSAIRDAQRQRDSLGGIFEVIVHGLTIGIGSFAEWDLRLDGLLAQSVMSIPGIKGVEFGFAFAQAAQLGSQVHDAIVSADAAPLADELPASALRSPIHRPTNRAAGIEGGLSNGEAIILRAAMKPLPTLPSPLPSIDLRSQTPAAAHVERTDTCAVPAAAIVAEAAVLWTLAATYRQKFGGDSLKETEAQHQAYQKQHLTPRP